MTRHSSVRVALLLGAVVALSTAARAESIFGLNLLGERFETGDARIAALGGFVQMSDDSLGVLQYNPAMVAWCKRVTFGAAGYVTTDRNKSATLDEKTVRTKFSTFAFGFPLFRKRLSMSFGYRGRYDPDGSFRETLTTDTGQAYVSIYNRSGGLWSVPFTLAFDAGKYAKIGAYYSIENGTLEDQWVVDFQGASTTDATSTRTRSLSGHGWGAGAAVRPIPKLSLGVAYEAAINYDTAVKERYTNAAANASYNETTTLPERWTASATFRVSPGFVVHAGGAMSDFTRFSGLAFPVDQLTREEIASLGVEYARGRSIPLRLSVTYEQLPYTLPDTQKITKMGFAIGTGLLFKSGRGKIDTALQFAKTGSVSTNDYQDKSVRFYLSITGSEEWKRKRETRY
jgi:hypothetical protein